MATLKDAWDAAKRCKERTGQSVSLTVEMRLSAYTGEKIEFFVHSYPEVCEKFSTLDEVVSHLDAAGLETCIESLGELPEVLAGAESKS